MVFAFMVINIDLTQLSEMINLPMGEVLWRIMFWYFGWLPLAIAFIWGSLQLWLYDRQGKWAAKNMKMIVLAIDIPQNNAQSPRAVENLFTYFAGAQKSPNLIEKWWEGYLQVNFSLEIVSIEGYIQFIIVAPQQFRSLVESAVYSQYPDAEITEVEDYTSGMPDRFPDKDYDLYGTELLPVAPQALPIKLYTEFEHQFGAPETYYRDPMASLMDLMSSLRKGEQLWLQFVIKPADFGWVKASEKEVGKILGEIKAIPSVTSIVAGHLGDIATSAWTGQAPEVKKKAEAEPLKMMQLKPNQKKKVELIQAKASKIGFETKIRIIYLAKKEVMNKPKVVNGFFGYLKQFHDGATNGFKPDSAKTATSTSYFRADERGDERKGKIIRYYKARSAWRGRLPFIMTVDELATMWHFPIDEVVKAPLVQRSAARRVEPPMRLPVGEAQPTVSYEAIFSDDYSLEEKQQAAPKQKEKPSSFSEFLAEEVSKNNNGKAKDEAPDNLPFV
jgi:hypothetical protein